MKPTLSRFQRIFWITAGVHGALIFVLLFYSVIQRWLIRKSPREVVTFVSLHTPAPPGPAVEAAVEAPPAPPPPPPPPPAPRPPVQRSTERVRRDPQPRPPPAQPQLTPEQIRQQLEQAVPTGVPASSGSPDNLAWYYSLIHETLFRAWEQPGSVLPGTTATARIRVQRDGSITRRDLVRRSGNSAMDDSVMRALESVSRLRPLPREVQGAHHDFTIEFELTGGAR